MSDTKTEDKDLVRVTYGGFLDGEWIGTTSQLFLMEIYINFIKPLSEKDKLLIYKFIFYLDHQKHIDEIRNVEVAMGKSFLPHRMD